MKAVKNGCSVTVSYIGTLDNGRIFHSTEEQGPFTFTIGAGQVFPALEQAVIGMKCGDVKNIVLTAPEAYGEHLQENCINISRSTFPAEKDISIGQKLSIDFKGGVTRIMIVSEINADTVKLDGNHPLAGQSLTFALRIDEIE